MLWIQVSLTDSYQYEDNQAGDEDVFAREPYILRFTCLHTGNVTYPTLSVLFQEVDMLASS